MFNEIIASNCHSIPDPPPTHSPPPQPRPLPPNACHVTSRHIASPQPDKWSMEAHTECIPSCPRGNFDDATEYPFFLPPFRPHFIHSSTHYYSVLGCSCSVVFKGYFAARYPLCVAFAFASSELLIGSV